MGDCIKNHNYEKNFRKQSFIGSLLDKGCLFTVRQPFVGIKTIKSVWKFLFIL